MIERRILEKDYIPKLTDEQLRQLEEAEKAEVVYDEDSPRLTPAMEKSFRLAAMSRNRLIQW